MAAFWRILLHQSTGFHAAQTINSIVKYIIMYMSIHEHPVTPNNHSCKLSQNPIHPIWWTLTIVEISLPQRHAKPDNVRNEKPITTVDVSGYCGFRQWPRFRTLVVALSEATWPHLRCVYTLAANCCVTQFKVQLQDKNNPSLSLERVFAASA